MTHPDIKLSLTLVDSVNGCILPFSVFVNRGFSSRNDDIMSWPIYSLLRINPQEFSGIVLKHIFMKLLGLCLKGWRKNQSQSPVGLCPVWGWERSSTSPFCLRFPPILPLQLKICKQMRRRLNFCHNRKQIWTNGKRNQLPSSIAFLDYWHKV